MPGTAGLGIADMMCDVMIHEGLSRAEATRCFYGLGSGGLLVDDSPKLCDFQMPYARPTAEVAGWSDSEDGAIRLAEVVSYVRPTMLIGTSTQAGAFTEGIVRPMAAYGLGLGVIVARARRITDPMIAAAADAVAHLSDATRLGAPVLPAVDDLRAISAAVGIAVAVAADREGLAQIPVDNPVQQVHEAMWRPEYPRLELDDQRLCHDQQLP